MKSLRGGLALAVLSFGMLGVLGCGEDNEAAIRAQEAKSSESDVKEPVKPVTDQRQQYTAPQDTYKKGTGYPGTGKK